MTKQNAESGAPPDIRPLLRQRLIDCGYTPETADDLLDWAERKGDEMRAHIDGSGRGR